MGLTKNIVIDKIEVLVETNKIQIRERTDIIENGSVISSSFKRWILQSGDDISSQIEKVQVIANSLWI